MSKKRTRRTLYKVYKIKNPKNGLNYVVYKREHGEVQPTYYGNRKIAEQDKDWVAG